MKRFALALMVALLCIGFASQVFAEGRTHDYKEFFFGDSFHNSPAGVKLNYLKVSWDENGVSDLGFALSAWKGQITFQDVWFVNQIGDKPFIVYKLTSKKKLNKTFCYLDCLYKKEDFIEYFTPPVKPFDINSGQIWFVMARGGETYHIVWDMKTNALDWFKAADKPAPPVKK